MRDIVECAISGQIPTSDQCRFVTEPEDLPEGWTQITIRSGRVNPRYETIQRAEQVLFQQAMMGVPPETPTEDRFQIAQVIRVQVEAQFAALKGITPKMIVVERTFFLAPETMVPEAKHTLQSIFVALGLREGMDVRLPNFDVDLPQGPNAA